MLTLFIVYLTFSIWKKKYIAAAISNRPIMPYIHRAPLRPNFFTAKRALSAVKNHSQSNSADSNDNAPASRKMPWTMLCRIIGRYSCGVQPCAFNCISTPSRVMRASPIVSLTMCPMTRTSFIAATFSWSAMGTVNSSS